MSKRNQIIFLAGVVIALAVGGYFVIRHKNVPEDNRVTQDNSSIIFFYGAECPHCQDVEKFIADNHIDQKVKFSKLEVWLNKPNANLMLEKAQQCGLSQDQLGVPFVWANGKCYMGTQDVENFFSSQAK
jgi:glutaredoxin